MAVTVPSQAAARVDVAGLRKKCEEAGQSHILEDWDSLSPEEQQQLGQTVQGLDFEFLRRALTASLQAAPGATPGVSPVSGALFPQAVDSATQQQWTRTGYRLIAEGRAAVLLLAGGQGTRLGSDAPKGCYDIGLPSHKSLFQLQAERLRRLQQLAAEAAAAEGGASAAGDRTGDGAQLLRWYIMTSPFTHEETLRHFEQHNYFGLVPDQVHFFQQGFLPCLTEEGQVIMSSSSQIAMAPDGNGGLYRALLTSGSLEHMERHGVQALDVYCVDNALARVADPAFLGACACAGAQLGCRVLVKAHPEERVGVFAQDAAGRLQVLEYSELPLEQASARDPATGQLLFGWSNICMHYFDVRWLSATASALAASGGSYHIARKRIPSKAGSVTPGVKLEMFIFDPFYLAERALLFQVDRAEQFAPVKNAPGSGVDAPETARASILAQGARWVAAAGGSVGAAAGVEVSPSVSYGGEGLAQLVAGRAYTDGVWLLGEQCGHDSRVT